MLSRVPSSGARRRGLSMPALGGLGHPWPILGLAPAAVAAQSLVAVGVARGVCVPPSGAGSVRLACSLVCGGALWLLSLCCLPGLWWSLAALPWLLWPRPGGGRWSVRRCRVALGVGAFGRRRGRFPVRSWSSGSVRPRRRRCSRRPGRAGSGSRWRFAGSRVRSGVSPFRWPSRCLSGCRSLLRFPLPWRGRGPLSGGGFCCAGVAGAPALWRVCRLQRQFSHWQLKPWSCRYSHWDEIHQQRVIVQGGGFGFGPFVPAPAHIKHL